MTRFTITLFPAVLALAAGAFVPATSAPQAAAGTGQPRVAAVTPGQQLWVQRYRGPQMPANAPADAVMSPDGTKVFVAGTSMGGEGREFATVAYSAATGARLWVAHFPAKWFLAHATSIAVSPGGGLVFVTGQDNRGAGTSDYGPPPDYVTVAYRAATGAQVWAARYNGPADGYDNVTSVAVSPRGDTVFVTGSSEGMVSGTDYATIAYRAGTGARLWVKRYNVTGRSDDEAAALTVSPDGQTAFVTGYTRTGSHADYLTIAYRAATGTLRWHTRYDGPGKGDDNASSVKVTPDGGTVVVTGASYGGWSSGKDWATVAYRAASGAQRWVSRYNGPRNLYDAASSLAVDPRGTRVYVTGVSAGNASGEDCATIAYQTATGARVWAKRYNGPGNRRDYGTSIATSPDGSKVFVTGAVDNTRSNGDYLTVGYRAATGAWLWGHRYNGPANRLDQTGTVVTSATRVIVTGVSYLILGNPGTSDSVTIAYAP